MLFPLPFSFLLRRFLCSSFSQFRKIYQECADMETRSKFTAAPRLPFGENRHINIKGDRRRLRLPSKPRKRKKNSGYSGGGRPPAAQQFGKRTLFYFFLGARNLCRPVSVSLSLSKGNKLTVGPFFQFLGVLLFSR